MSRKPNIDHDLQSFYKRTLECLLIHLPFKKREEMMILPFRSRKGDIMLKAECSLVVKRPLLQDYHKLSAWPFKQWQIYLKGNLKKSHYSLKERCVMMRSAEILIAGCQIYLMSLW